MGVGINTNSIPLWSLYTYAIGYNNPQNPILITKAPVVCNEDC